MHCLFPYWYLRLASRLADIPATPSILPVIWDPASSTRYCLSQARGTVTGATPGCLSLALFWVLCWLWLHLPWLDIRLSFYHFHPFFIEGLQHGIRHFPVGNDLIHLIHITDFSETPFAEFGGIGQHNRLLSSCHHMTIQ